VRFKRVPSLGLKFKRTEYLKQIPFNRIDNLNESAVRAPKFFLNFLECSHETWNLHRVIARFVVFIASARHAVCQAGSVVRLSNYVLPQSFYDTPRNADIGWRITLSSLTVSRSTARKTPSIVTGWVPGFMARPLPQEHQRAGHPAGK
jgi:hypothetical protein